MSIIKSFNRIRNLAYLGQEINHLFTKHGHHMAVKLCRPVLMQYYKQMDYDWREWQATNQGATPSCNYTKTQVPINTIIPAPGAPLGYRFRTCGENQYPFDMYIITWQPRQKSPVHYHPVYGCTLLTLQGQLQEKLFVMDRDNNKLRANGWRIINQGQSSYIDNIIGAHQICNPYDVPAVSLHIYAPKGAQVRNIHYPTDTNNT
jgi:hypothetical protein